MSLKDMTLDELAVERQKLDEQMQEIRKKKLAIQQEVDRRPATPKPGVTVTDAGGIESAEGVGGMG